MADEVERRTVWVGGIPPALAEPLDTVLESIFDRFGPISKLNVRQKAGENRSWAFVTYQDEAAADLACEAAAGGGLLTPSTRREQGVALVRALARGCPSGSRIAV